MDSFEICSFLADRAICDLQAPSYINHYSLFRHAAYRMLELDIFGHDEVQNILNRLLISEKKGSYLLSDGFAMPHLVIDSPDESKSRIGWFVSKDGTPYGPSGDVVYVWLFIIGSKRFVRRASTVSVEICKGQEFIHVSNRLNNVEEFREYIRNRIDIAFGLFDLGIPAVFYSTENIARRDVTVRNKLGFHARASSKFTQLARRFECAIIVKKTGGREADAKSIMGVMSLAVGRGSTIQISAQGKGALDAVSALAGLVEQGFGEDWARTSIMARCDVGWGRELYLRGSQAPLSWLRGVKMRCRQGRVWVWQSTDIPMGAELEFKVLIDDHVWQATPGGRNLLVKGGDYNLFEPEFE